MSAPATSEARPVLDVDAVARLPELERVAGLLHPGSDVSVGNLWGSSQALFLAALALRLPGPWVVLASSDAEAQVLAEDLAAFGLEADWFPARESGTGRGRATADPDHVRQRLQVAQRLTGPPEERPRALVASLLSLLQPIPAAVDLAKDLLRLAVGARLDPERLLERLVARGYARQPLVERPGEISLRGDILDVYPFASDLPLRVELFDEEVESLRTFDPADQRSVAALQEVQLSLAVDAGGVEQGDGVQPTKLLAPTAVIVAVEPLRIEDQAQSLRVRSGAHERALDALERSAAQRPRLALQSLPGETANLDTRSVQRLAVGIKEAPAALREAVGEERAAVVLCQNEAEARRFHALVEEAGGVPRLDVRVGSLAKGFELPAAGLLALNHRELLGIVGRRTSRSTHAVHHTRAVQSFFELKAGDLVVHAVHGLALYRGLVEMERAGASEEHLHLVFADEVSLYVPANRIDVVQRYIGASAIVPPLDRIGGQSFRKRKEKVQRALVDLAGGLLEVHAKRSLRERPAWPADDEIVRTMLEAFPYEETKDQDQADAEIAGDLRGSRPMDRLLCGDVGFGKTELAVRAAFRVVCGGGQVAVLVPTTVLAQQHFQTFGERLADFPVRVELLSRYVGDARAKEVLENAAKGEVDVLIGTHRILSKDVELPKLGLVVIDEEQRFGVVHKEHFKALRSEIDVLTLSATPIPRTLHMSISGVRDISALTVPPEGRQEIETILGYVEDDAEVRDALLREHNRGGQVFFLHNRVQSIEAVAQRLANLVPECSYAIGHGQMGARELQRVMNAFARGDVDVLVATTIIESGIDIPAAGTIVINDADCFGLSELHQLRGRVGRGSSKAYCYLLVEKHKPLRQVARERLKALEEMNQLGAGFAISMKDLEIRGAGNILGPQQSGHIGAVGYDLYCRLLKHTIERLRAGEPSDQVAAEDPLDAGVELELGVDAYLPRGWIPEQDTRLELLRRLSAIEDERDLEEAAAMLRDRFGRVPDAARGLLRAFLLQARLRQRGLRRVAWQQDRYLLEFEDRVALERWLAPHAVELRPIRAGVAHLMLPAKVKSAAAGLRWLERLLKPA